MGRPAATAVEEPGEEGKHHHGWPERRKDYENEAWFHPHLKVLIRLTVSCHDPVNERLG
jgi:hypothetical protein